MRAHLARLLVEEPDLLMLDEPTNHLDLNSLMWFQKYLQQYPGALLIISHDRSFMDGVVEKVYEIDEQKFINYTGNYTKYLQLKDERYDQQMKAFQNQKKEIARIQKFIDKSDIYDSFFTARPIREYIWSDAGPVNFDLTELPNSKDLTGFWKETHGMYGIKMNVLNRLSRRLGNKPLPIEISEKESLDIDYYSDIEYF